MYIKIASFLLGAVLFVSFVGYSYLVNKNVFSQLDFDTTVRLQDNIPRHVDTVFSLFSEVGSFEVSLVIMLALTGFLFWKRKFLAGFFVFSLFGMFHVLEIFGKRFVDHFPPPQFMLRTEDQFAFPQFHVREENSYPSGHSGRAAFLSIVIIFLVLRSKKLTHLQKTLIIGCIVIYDVIMWSSRIYLGEHWMSDVIGGTILGFALGFVTAASL